MNYAAFTAQRAGSNPRFWVLALCAILGLQIHAQELSNSILSSGHTLSSSANNSMSQLGSLTSTGNSGLISILDIVDVAIEEKDTTTTLATVPAFNLSVFPNPTTSQLNIVSDLNDIEVRVSDLRGTFLFSKNIGGGKSQIDFGSIASGVYLVHLFHKNHTLKIIRILKE